MADNRLNLDENLHELTDNLLRDVQEAAEAVKKRHAEYKEEEKRAAQKAASKKQVGLMVAIGTIFVILLSYWIVFARPETNNLSQTAAGPTTVQSQEGPKVKITVPATPRATSPMTAPAAGFQPPKDAQVVEHPSDEYEPPSGDSGM